MSDIEFRTNSVDKIEKAEGEKAALIAMSGGVDSSVAAYEMVRKGFKCAGCTMRLYENDMIGEELLGTCCSIKDTEDARAVADKLGIPYYIYHYEAEFRDKVIEPFVCSYEKGETPNPCIRCNRYLKFDSLYKKAKELGADYIVTGHYARIKEQNGHFYLMKAKDLSKDQSYVLYDLTEEQLKATAFPLGDMNSKNEAREIAEKEGFVTSHKSDSQDICFVPDGDYASLIKRYRGKEYPKGDFVDLEGNVLGTHDGIINYTIGQRRGLGIPADRRLYVTRLDVDAKEINDLVDKLNGANNGIADNVSSLSAASEQISASTREATESSSKNVELISNFQILMAEISTMVSELKTNNNASQG